MAPTSTRERILQALKRHGPQTAGELAPRLGVTPMAVRQHLYQLASAGQVGHQDRRRPVGRPARYWELDDGAAAAFPDAHAELTVDLLGSVRDAFGEDGLAALIDARTARQRTAYAAQLPPPDSPLAERVAALAAIREAEGYMAEVSEDDAGFELVEHHCPICVAATRCQGLCDGELALFRSLLPDAQVVRTEHLLADGRRCRYRITPDRGDR